MPVLSIRLLGKFSAQIDERQLEGLDAFKVQELFCYLLLHRERPHSREILAGMLWGESTTALSKKYLRQALWHLQHALDSPLEASDERLLNVTPEWVQVNPRAEWSLDVAAFEDALATFQNAPGQTLDVGSVQALRLAVELYRGDLLEGWYQDWCLYKREQLQNKFLCILDKLIVYSEKHHEYEMGLTYGERVLRYDRARERTYRHLMRLHYLAGDRTAGLRQYERCVAALEQELGVKPSKRTTMLYEQIRADQLDEPVQTTPGEGLTPDQMPSLLPELLGRIKQLQEGLADIQRQIQQGIKAAQAPVKNRR